MAGKILENLMLVKLKLEHLKLAQIEGLFWQPPSSHADLKTSTKTVNSYKYRWLKPQQKHGFCRWFMMQMLTLNLNFVIGAL